MGGAGDMQDLELKRHREDGVIIIIYCYYTFL